MTIEDRQNKLISLLHEIKKYEKQDDPAMVSLLVDEYNTLLKCREDQDDR